MSIITEYPVWLIFVCMLSAGALSWFLYRKFPIQFERFKFAGNLVLTIFRFFSIFFITLLLLNPLIKTVTSRLEKPLLVIAVDQSQSILANKDSLFYRTQLLAQLNQFTEKFGDDYTIERLAFSDKISVWNAQTVFSGKQTDISQVFNDFNTRYDNLNIGALVLASDGLYNKGNNPLYQAERYKFPVYTLALGDTTPQKDILVRQAKHNEIAFIGNKFPLKVELEANDCKGEKVLYSLFQNGKLIFSQPLLIKQDQEFIELPYELDAKEAGVQHFVANVSRLTNEISYSNNSKDFFVEVLDGKQKILLVAASPHPDIAALKYALEANKNYELKVAMLNETAKLQNLEAYNLVILYQVPSQVNNATLFINQVKEKKIPQLYILGSQSNVNAFNTLQNLLSVQTGTASSNDAVPVHNSGFGLFTVSEETANQFKQLPPLSAPFGVYNSSNDAEVLFTQQIGYVKTNTPLMCFSKNSETRTGIVAGEGLWRWRISEFASNGNYTAFEELISKTVQYLSVKEDKRPFRMVNPQKFFNENEPIAFDVQLHNESYQLVNTPDVSFDLFDETGKKYHYTFSKTSNAYTLNAGLFPPGNYVYHAQTSLNGKAYQIDGKLSVLPLQVELARTVADHKLLSTLASNTNGKMFYPNQLEALYKAIRENEEIKPVSYRDRATNDLISYKWIFFLIVAMMIVEWFVRKNQGTV